MALSRNETESADNNLPTVNEGDFVEFELPEIKAQDPNETQVFPDINSVAYNLFHPANEINLSTEEQPIRRRFEHYSEMYPSGFSDGKTWGDNQ